MMHRNELTGWKEVLIPWAVQVAFWDGVLLPALWKVSSLIDQQYLHRTVDSFMQKSKGRTYSPKTFPFEKLDDLQNAMREFIKNDDTGKLNRFGSFFFVLEAKGFKSRVRFRLDQGEDPWTELRNSFRYLDFEYMCDRKNGEFVVDLGYCLTPNRPAESKGIAGLWRIEALEASYGAAGFRKGNVHHANMFARYGSMQAEMSSERARRTHVTFRSTYNLIYEATRSPSNVPYFAEDSDAYHRTPDYVKDCERRTSLFDKSKADRHFGVRDEYRVGGTALRAIFEKSLPMVRSFPVLEKISVLTPASAKEFLRFQTNSVD